MTSQNYPSLKVGQAKTRDAVPWPNPSSGQNGPTVASTMPEIHMALVTALCRGQLPLLLLLLVQ